MFLSKTFTVLIAVFRIVIWVNFWIWCKGWVQLHASACDFSIAQYHLMKDYSFPQWTFMAHYQLIVNVMAFSSSHSWTLSPLPTCQDLVEEWGPNYWLHLPEIYSLQCIGGRDKKSWQSSFFGKYCSSWLWTGQERYPWLLVTFVLNRASIMLSWGQGVEDEADCGSSAIETHYSDKS